ncbi:MAG: esterase [Bacteroidetes bacterium]|nr:esterase [Bacteroidota bacterium]
MKYIDNNCLIRTFTVLLISMGFIACKNNQSERKPINDPNTTVVENPFKKVDSVQLSSGSLLRINNFDSKYVSPRNIDVWLPENYSKDNTYQVLLMHDGQMLFDSTTTWNKQEWGLDETLSQLIKTDSIKPTIVVSTWNVFKDRHSDYFPQKPFDNLEDETKKNLIDYNQSNSDRLFKKLPQSDDYLKFLVQEVIPLVKNHFSILDQPQSITVAGSSMGGLISFYALCEYPDIFGQAICMSTHWPGAMPFEDNPFPQAVFDYLDDKLPQLNNHKFYFDFGTETLDELYPQYEDEVNQLFAKHNFNSSNFKNIKYEGDAHDEKSWRQRLHIPLKFALK